MEKFFGGKQEGLLWEMCKGKWRICENSIIDPFIVWLNGWMEGDLREQTCFRFYQVMAKKLPSLSRNELEEGLSSLKCNSPQVRLSGFWNLESFCFWNRKSWALETGIQHKESGIPLTIGLRNRDPLRASHESPGNFSQGDLTGFIQKIATIF